MNREDDKKLVDEQNQQTAKTPEQINSRHEDEHEHSYPGKLDHVEGRMNNGEIGGGILKEDDQS